MDEDFYIEETSPLKVILTIILVIAVIAGGIWAYYKYFPKDRLKLKDITMELGEKLSDDIEDYASGNTLNNYKLDISNVHVDEDGNTDSAGEYSYKLINGATIKKGKVFVKDTTAPKVTTENITVGVNEDFEPSEFLKTCDDLSTPCKVTYKDDSDADLNKKEGTYSVTIIVSDAFDNEVSKNVKLTVSSTETLLSKKRSDFEVSYTSPDDKEWNNTYTYKFEKCVSDESHDYESEIMELTSKDFETEKTIKEREIVVAYNKYNYVIGISVKLIFDDDTILFVTE